MATLNTTELAKVRNVCEKTLGAVAYTKPQVNAALQAIEDAMITRAIVAGDVTKTIPQIISAEIDASSAFGFTNAQKKLLFALWAELKFQRDK